MAEESLSLLGAKLTPLFFTTSGNPEIWSLSLRGQRQDAKTAGSLLLTVLQKNDRCCSSISQLWHMSAINGHRKGGTLHIRCTYSLIVVLFLAASQGQSETYAVVPVEVAGTVASGDIQAYYDGMVRALVRRPQVRVLERAKFKAVLDELDLARAMKPEDSGARYRKVTRQLGADHLLVPSICQMKHGYMLTLRHISLKDGATQGCAVRKVRLVSKFGGAAGALATDVLGDSDSDNGSTAADPKGLSSAMQCTEVRLECLAASADKLFPALWKRVEGIKLTAKAGANADRATGYYVALLHLTRRAASPPEGMVFVPGGYVTMETSGGPRKLWVEPFFIDQCEVSVGRYKGFLQHLQQTGDAEALKACRPITHAHRDFSDKNLPVTGVTWHAAAAFATWRDMQLPMELQWRRAAFGEPIRGASADQTTVRPKCNLRGEDDGYAVLAPVSEPGKDVSDAGVVGLGGNVREWTSTWYSKDAYADTPADCPRGPASGLTRVVCGSSWRLGDEERGVAYRSSGKPGEAFDDVGLRCALPLFVSGKKPSAGNGM